MVLLFFPAGAWADDVTFRNLPLQRTPSPEELIERISDPALRKIVEQFQRRRLERSPGTPGEAAEEDPLSSLPDLSGLSPELIEQMKELGVDPDIQPFSPDQTPRDLPREAFPESSPPESSPPSRSEPRKPALERFPPRTERPREMPAPSELPEGAGRPGNRVPQRGPGGEGNETSPESAGPRPSFRLPQSPQGESLGETARERVTPPRNLRPGSEDEPTAASDRPRSRSEIDESVNRIVMDVARRVAEREAETGGIESSLSRESFLTPLVKRAERAIAQRSRWNSREPSWLRNGSRQVRSWNPARRLDLPSLPSAPSAGSIGGPAQWKLLAAPVLFGAVVLLLAPVWVRLRPRLMAYLNASKTLASLRTVRIDAPGELVQAVDRFLLAQFGLAAAWWHCRTVEQELRRLRPEMSQELAALATAYELARYGPDAAAIDAARLEQSAQTLRRLADPAASEPVHPPSAA
jgi:hypothetical protein